MSAMKNELALFHSGTKEKGVQEICWINFRPVSQISNSSAIEFNINGTSSDYILLSKTRLHVKVRILRSDGTPVQVTDDVALVNLGLHSLFRQVDILLNQQIISTGVGTNYPYKSLIDVTLAYDHGEKSTQLLSELYTKDSSFYMSDTLSNVGHLQRKSYTQHGIADLEGVLHMDVAQQPKAIPNGVQVTVKLFQHDDSFRLLSAGGATYGVEIVDAVLKVCHIKVEPKVIVAQNEILLKTPAVYPLWKSEIKTYGIAQGSYTFSIDDMFHGIVPARLIVGLVLSSGYSGSFDKNPFDFNHFYLNYLELSVDGQSVPSVAFQPHYQDNPDVAGQILPTGYVAEFLSLFKNHYPQTGGNWIERQEYPCGYALYVFNLKPGVDDKLFSSLQSGHTRLNARFAQELPEPVTVIAYGIFPSNFKIDHARNVIV